LECSRRSRIRSDSFKFPCRFPFERESEAKSLNCVPVY
jgi:hypothetical protein